MIHTLSSQQSEIHKVTISNSHNSQIMMVVDMDIFLMNSLSPAGNIYIHRIGILVKYSALNLFYTKNEIHTCESKC